MAFGAVLSGSVSDCCGFHSAQKLICIRASHTSYFNNRGASVPDLVFVCVTAVDSARWLLRVLSSKHWIGGHSQITASPRCSHSAVPILREFTYTN